MAIRPEIMCRPPENRRIVASSAARTVVFETSTRASSSLTSMVSANRHSILLFEAGRHGGRQAVLLFSSEVAVLEAHRDAGKFLEQTSQFPGHGDGAVLAARAA